MFQIWPVMRNISCFLNNGGDHKIFPAPHQCSTDRYSPRLLKLHRMRITSTKMLMVKRVIGSDRVVYSASGKIVNVFMKAVRYCALFACITMAGSLLCAGCAPVISQGALKEVDQTLSFEQVLENPQAYKGRIVLLGGDIIETQNLSDRTLIIVLQRSLGFNKKPKAKDVSRGRFIVYILGFLDPAIYRQGRKITVVGSVMGRELRTLGEIEYSYPVIEKKELYLWPTDGYFVTEPRVHFGVGIGIWR